MSTLNWVSNPSETHGPLMTVANWTLTGIAAGFLVLRLYVRYLKGKLWIDDLILAASWVSPLRLTVYPKLNQIDHSRGASDSLAAEH